jgi:hypothetical protein
MPTFSDGAAGSTLETAHDLSAWTGTNADGSNTVAASTTFANSGSYSIKSYQAAWGNQAVAYKSLASASTYYARCYVRYTNMLDSGGRYSRFLILGDGINYEHISACIKLYDDPTVPKWCLFYSDGGADQVAVLDSDYPEINTWYCIEIKGVISATVGEARFYLNGVEKLTATGLNNDDWGNFDRVEVGQYFSEGPYGDITNYIDDVVVDTAYIGPISAPPSTPTLKRMNLTRGISRLGGLAFNKSLKPRMVV